MLHETMIGNVVQVKGIERYLQPAKYENIFINSVDIKSNNSTKTLTREESGTIFNVYNGCQITLPEITPENVGSHYTFIAAVPGQTKDFRTFSGDAEITGQFIVSKREHTPHLFVAPAAGASKVLSNNKDTGNGVESLYKFIVTSTGYICNGILQVSHGGSPSTPFVA